MSESEIINPINGTEAVNAAKNEMRAERNAENVRVLYERVGKKIAELVDLKSEKFTDAEKEKLNEDLGQLKGKIYDAEDLIRKGNGTSEYDELRNRLKATETMLDGKFESKNEDETKSEQLNKLLAENERLKTENEELKKKITKQEGIIGRAKATIKNLSKKVLFAIKNNGDAGAVITSFFFDQTNNKDIFADNAVREEAEKELNGEADDSSNKDSADVKIEDKSSSDVIDDSSNKNSADVKTEDKSSSDADVAKNVDVTNVKTNEKNNDQLLQSIIDEVHGWNSLEEFNDPETQAMARDIARKKAVDDKPYIPRSSTPEGQKKIKDYSTPEGQRRMKKAFSIENADGQKSKEDEFFEEIARGAEKAANEAIEGTDKKSKPESPKINPGGVDSAHFGRNAEYEGGYAKENKGWFGRLFSFGSDTDEMSAEELDRIIAENQKLAERARKRLEKNKNGGNR